MRHLYGLPFCGPALERPVVLVRQPRENRRAFRHESVARQGIRVAIACPTSIALPTRHVLSVTIDLRDNQKACQDSSLRICRAFDSLAPPSSPFGLPVYVARRPPAPFCETPPLRLTNIGGSVTREVFPRNY